MGNANSARTLKSKGEEKPRRRGVKSSSLPAKVVKMYLGRTLRVANAGILEIGACPHSSLPPPRADWRPRSVNGLIFSDPTYGPRSGAHESLYLGETRTVTARSEVLYHRRQQPVCKNSSLTTGLFSKMKLER